MGVFELELELIHLNNTKANGAGRRGGLRAAPARTENQEPFSAAATRQSAVLLVVSPIKGLFFASPLFSPLPGVPVTPASRLLGLGLAVPRLLLAPELG